jgi:hypothetical protein
VAAGGSVAARCVATGPVVTAPGNEQNGYQQEDDERNDPEHLHPPWCASRLRILFCHAVMPVPSLPFVVHPSNFTRHIVRIKS